MIDDEQLASIVHQLKIAGLPEVVSGGGGGDGGFGLRPVEDVVRVQWHSSSEMSSVAFDLIGRGDVAAPAVQHMGRIELAMGDAMLTILRSAGFNATMSADDLSPGTVEVRFGDSPATQSVEARLFPDTS